MEAKVKGLFHCITILFFLSLLCETKIGFLCCTESFSLLKNVGLWNFKYHSHRVFLLLFSLVSKLSYLPALSTWLDRCRVQERHVAAEAVIQNFFHSCRESSHCRGNTKKKKKNEGGGGDCWQIKNRKKMQMWGLALVNKPQIIFQVGAMCKECLIVLPHPTSLCCLI